MTKTYKEKKVLQQESNLWPSYFGRSTNELKETCGVRHLYYRNLHAARISLSESIPVSFAENIISKSL